MSAAAAADVTADAAAVAPVLDAHLHLWDRERFDYPWMAGRAELPAASLPTEPGFPQIGTDLIGWDSAEGHRPAVGAAVFVEAGTAPEQRMTEAAWVADHAGDFGIVGIVAAVDLAEPARLQRDLDRLADIPLIVGVRDNFEGLPAGAMADRLAGALSVLAAGLRIDVCIRREQVNELHGWLSAVVRERGTAADIVLDHIAKPGLDELDGRGGPSAASAADVIDRARDEWLPGLRSLAELPGIHVKYSGLPGQVAGPVSADTAIRLAEAFGPAVLESFGPRRVLFGSDHPVSTLAHGLDYREWLAAVKGVLDTCLAPAEKLAVLAGNAARFYGIG